VLVRALPDWLGGLRSCNNFHKELAMKSTKLSKRFIETAANVPLGWVPSNVLAQKDMFLRKVVFDFHGPIVDFNNPIAAHLSGLYGVEVDPALMLDHYKWGYNSRMPITQPQFEAGLEHFGRLARGGFSDFPAMPGAVEAIKQITAAGIAVEIWTYVPGATDYNHDTLLARGTGIAQLGTMELIEKLGVVANPRKQVRFIRPDQKVARMALEHIPLIVEDHPVTAVQAGAEYGHAAILVPEPYNVGVSAPGVLRLENRADLAPAIIEFYKKLDEAGCLID